MTAEPSQIKNGISNQLPGPMKSNIAAAIALEDLNAASGQLFGRSEHMSSLGIASKGNDGRMFQQQQHVVDLSSLAQINQPLLQPNPVAIINLAELDDRNHVAIEIIGPQCSAGILPAVLSASRARHGGRGRPPDSRRGRRRYSLGQLIPGRGLCLWVLIPKNVLHLS